MGRVAFFCIPYLSHFRRCRALLHAIAGAGLELKVFSARWFKADATAMGASLTDIFSEHPFNSIPDDSNPPPCRWVTWTADHVQELIEEVRAFDPQLVVLDSFAVFGRVVAMALGVPYVNVCAGHNIRPDRWIPILQNWESLWISPNCRRGAERLREVHGIEDASPFSWIAPPSPFLNVYCEPPQFLSDSDREAFEPVVFFGSLPSPESTWAASEPSVQAAGRRGGLRLYVSLGTYSWLQWPREAEAAARAITSAIESMPGVTAHFGMGWAPEALMREIAGPSVRVERFADQWQALTQADAFITHNGLNSTHEAIWHGVPMLSYPFSGDQPELAELCRQLNVAVPLSAEPPKFTKPPALGPADVRLALERLPSELERMDAGLALVRTWEEEVIADRRAAVQRILDLIER